MNDIEFCSMVDELSLLNEDYQMTIPTAIQVNEEIEQEKEDTTDESPRQLVKKAIEPQKDIAVSCAQTIADMFKDDCNHTKMYNDMEDQIKNIEKQLRGACEQIVAVVTSKKFNYKDNTQCSPKAYKKIGDSSSRDLSSIELCAAIIVFYNSLG